MTKKQQHQHTAWKSHFINLYELFLFWTFDHRFAQLNNTLIMDKKNNASLQKKKRHYHVCEWSCKTVFRSNTETPSRDQLPPLNRLIGLGGD